MKENVLVLPYIKDQNGLPFKLGGLVYERNGHFSFIFGERDNTINPLEQSKKLLLENSSYTVDDDRCLYMNSLVSLQPIGEVSFIFDIFLVDVSDLSIVDEKLVKEGVIFKFKELSTIIKTDDVLVLACLMKLINLFFDKTFLMEELNGE